MQAISIAAVIPMFMLISFQDDFKSLNPANPVHFFAICKRCYAAVARNNMKGFYIVTYGLGIYNLNLLLGFITPQVDPEFEEGGPELPTKSDQEFKPFVRRLPEFKFWWSSIKSLWIGMAMTLFTMFDVPVFWPILLLYWFLLFTVTMKRQIKHMIKYKYLPFTTGKKWQHSTKCGRRLYTVDTATKGRHKAMKVEIVCIM
eukprot:gene6128-6367_t